MIVPVCPECGEEMETINETDWMCSNTECDNENFYDEEGNETE